jgi:class 3 adenylate cyclase
VGFSNATMNMAAEEVIAILNRYFTAFDRIVERYGLEKLKTIGDSYMFVSGLPERRASNPVDAVLAAMEMVETVREFCGAEGCGWQVRIGLHTGPVVAGVVGISKYAFDIWGETVNVASRMESCGAPNRVNISERTCNRVKDFVTTEARGKVRTKEGRELEMFFVGGVPEDLIDDRTADLPPRFAEQYLTQFGAAARSFPRHLLAMAETTTSTM